MLLQVRRIRGPGLRTRGILPCRLRFGGVGQDHSYVIDSRGLTCGTGLSFTTSSSRAIANSCCRLLLAVWPGPTTLGATLAPHTAQPFFVVLVFVDQVHAFSYRAWKAATFVFSG